MEVGGCCHDGGSNSGGDCYSLFAVIVVVVAATATAAGRDKEMKWGR